MDQCQKARSPAKNRPAAAAQNTLRPGRVSVPPVFGAIGDGFLSFPKPEKFRCAPMAFQARKKGRARNTRWKAVAVGGNSLSRWAFSALIIGALCIAFSPILVRLSEFPPTATAFHRVFLALPFFLAWNAMGAHRNFSGLGKDRQPSPSAPNTGGTETRPGRSVFWAAAAGLFFAGDLAFWHWSINYTSVANATLLATLAPVFVTLIAWLLFGEHITGRFLAGMIIAILGTSLLVRA